MCCVYTNSNPAFVLYLADNLCNLFESIAQICSLTGSILNHSCYTRGFIQRHINRLGYF